MPEIFTRWRVTALFTLVLSLALSASALAQNSNQSTPAANTEKPAKGNEQEKPAENQAPKQTAGSQSREGQRNQGQVHFESCERGHAGHRLEGERGSGC